MYKGKIHLVNIVYSLFKFDYVFLIRICFFIRTYIYVTYVEVETFSRAKVGATFVVNRTERPYRLLYGCS